MQKIVEDFAQELVAKVFMINMQSARDAWKMIERVVRLSLTKHVGRDKPDDVHRVMKIILSRLINEAEAPSYIQNAENGTVQTCLVVMARSVTLDYVRGAHYAQSSLAEIFKAMNVDVTGAEAYLHVLDDLFTPTQKCVLGLIYGEGCTASQAAGMLGVSQQEVRTIEWQAMEILQHEWLTLRRASAC